MHWFEILGCCLCVIVILGNGMSIWRQLAPVISSMLAQWATRTYPCDPCPVWPTCPNVPPCEACNIGLVVLFTVLIMIMLSCIVLMLVDDMSLRPGHEANGREKERKRIRSLHRQHSADAVRLAECVNTEDFDQVNLVLRHFSVERVENITRSDFDALVTKLRQEERDARLEKLAPTTAPSSSQGIFPDAITMMAAVKSGTEINSLEQ